jgi:carbamate kinase
MRILVALGGNALLPRGQRLSASAQQVAVRVAARVLAAAAAGGHHLIITHGNGPQVGLLALQSAAGPSDGALPLDVLDAESEGWIGYAIELELRNAMGAGSALATLLTQIRVDRADAAFGVPTKPVGPVYDEATARRLATANGWSVAPDGAHWRRVVASPRPIEILELASIRLLVKAGVTVICAGGGGIPVFVDADGRLTGAEAVIDKDASSALLAEQIGVELFVMLTDVEGVFLDYGKPNAQMIRDTSPDALEAEAASFHAGSIGPKVAAACAFARATGCRATIGALADLHDLIGATAGTSIAMRTATTPSVVETPPKTAKDFAA